MRPERPLSQPANPDGYRDHLHDVKGLNDGYAPYPPGIRWTEFQKAKARAAKYRQRDFNWQERGPGRTGGRTRSIALDLSDPTERTFYAGSVGGGLWRGVLDRDAISGQTFITWTALTDDLLSLSVGAIGVTPDDPDVIYLGTGEGHGGGFTEGVGPFKSTDRGATWEILLSDAERAHGSTAWYWMYDIIVDPANANHVVAAADERIYRSTDGGANWTKTYESPAFTQHVQDLKADPTDFNVQYAAVEAHGVLKSTDGGATWQDALMSFVTGSGRIEIAIAPSDPDYVYLAVDAQGGELYRSVDKGETWQYLNNNSEGKWLGIQGWYDNAIGVHPFARDTLYLGGIYLWKAVISATDDSYTLQSWDNGEVHVDHHNFLMIPKDEVTNDFAILNVNDGGVAYSANGGDSWIEGDRTPGYNTAQFYDGTKRPGYDQYFGGTQDNGTWLSPGNAQRLSGWRHVIGGDGFDVIWKGGNGGDSLIGTLYDNSIKRSLNGGQSFDYAEDGLGDNWESGRTQFWTTLGWSPKRGNTVFTIGESGVWRTDNFARSWYGVSVDNSRWGYSGRNGKVRVSIADPFVVWAGYRLRHSDGVSTLHVSRDGGSSFSPVTRPELGPTSTISGLATHPHEPGTAYVLFSVWRRPKVLRTEDYGETWQDISGYRGLEVSDNGFPEMPTWDLAVLPNRSDTLWVGTDIGIFQSPDNGQSWHYLDTGLPAAPVYRIRMVDHQAVVTTHGRGIWTVDLSEAANASPITQFRATPREGNVPLSVDFDASASTDTDGTITGYAWDFGDGTSGSGVTASHTYTVIGKFTATLTVTDDGGATGTATETITVRDPNAVTVSFQDGTAPTTNYSGTQDTKIVEDHPISFYGDDPHLEVDGLSDKAVLLKWDLSSLPAGSTVESAAITVQITDESGDTYEVYEMKRDWVESETHWLQYRNGQNWQAQGANGTLDRGSDVLGRLQAASIGATSIALNETAETLIQQWIDNPATNYGVILLDYDDASSNGVDFDSREVDDADRRPKLTFTYTPPAVNQLPVASFTATPRSGTRPLSVEFDASASTDSDGTIARYAWDFGDGNADFSVTTNHVFTDVGNYIVTLTVTDNAGGSGMATDSISVIDNVAVVGSSEIPRAAALLPNYPNPFNPVTSLGFGVPDRMHVRIHVYDLNGRQVATLADRPYRAGWHVVTWDAGQLASGRYIARMVANERLIGTQSMMLVK